MARGGAIAAVLALLLAAVGVPTIAVADIEDFHFASMHADYTLGRDADGHSTLEVVETFAPRASDVDHDDGVYNMTSRADGYLRGAQTFVFAYTLENVTWSFDDTSDEFYWDINGNDWAAVSAAAGCRPSPGSASSVLWGSPWSSDDAT